MFRVNVNAHCIDGSIITWYTNKDSEKEAKKFVINKKVWLRSNLGKVIKRFTISIMEVNDDTGKHLSENSESTEAIREQPES